MIKNRLAKWMFGSTFLAALMVPALALAEEGAEGAAQAAVDPKVAMAKAIAAAVTMSVGAMSAAYAQARIGSAGAGTLAERPEVATYLIVLQALPEIIVLLAFVIAFMVK